MSEMYKMDVLQTKNNYKHFDHDTGYSQTFSLAKIVQVYNRLKFKKSYGIKFQNSQYPSNEI